MKVLRVALITDAMGPPTRGNGTTVHRWLGWLPDVHVQMTPISPGFDLLPGRKPDLVHGYHAIRGGVAAARLASLHNLPLVISLGGTDLHDLRRGVDRADAVRAVLAAADVITGAFPDFQRVLQAALDPAPPYAVVPRGVHLPDDQPPAPSDTLRIFLPAGIRPVKDPLLALRLLDRLRAAGLPAHLTIAGPVLDEAYAPMFRAEVAKRDHVTWVEVSRTEMATHYAGSDVVWNTSLHEGGANALLEGLAHGCAVYARDVPGNHDLLAVPDAPGALFDDDAADLVRFHTVLLHEDPEARFTRVSVARAWLAKQHDSLAEARALRKAYEQVL